MHLMTSLLSVLVWADTKVIAKGAREMTQVTKAAAKRRFRD